MQFANLSKCLNRLKKQDQAWSTEDGNTTGCACVYIMISYTVYKSGPHTVTQCNGQIFCQLVVNGCSTIMIVSSGPSVYLMLAPTKGEISWISVSDDKLIGQTITRFAFFLSESADL